MADPPGRRATTLRDVAEFAGVSTSTASRALSGGHHVSAALLERVRGAAAELSYRANEAARGLRMARTMTFGVVFPRLESQVTLDVLNGITGAGDERGYTLLVTNARGDDEQYELLIRRLFGLRVDALLLANPAGVRQDLDPFVAANVPVLSLFSRGEDCAGIPLVTAPEDRAIEQAIARLATLGHRSLAYIATDADGRPGAIESATAAAGIRCRRELLEDGPAYESMLDVMRGVTGPEHRATAVIASHRHLPSLMSALATLGLSVPGDISVLTFTDSIPADEIVSPPMSAIRVNTEELGRRAVTLLADWLEGEEPPNVTSLELSSWTERGSVGSAPATTAQPTA